MSEASPPPISPVEGTDRPFWSVMIPTYNGARYLAESLGSVLAQDPGPDRMQIEVVDDCSTEWDPEPAIRELAGTRVEFFRQPVNLGHHRNFNTCIRRARGQVVHILNDDDTVRLGFYHRLEEGLQVRPDAGAAFSRHIYCDIDGHWRSISPLERESPGVLEDWLKKIAAGQRLTTPAMVVRRSTYEALGGFDVQGGLGEDWEMWVRIATRYPVWFEPEPLAVYRMRRPGSLTDADRISLIQGMLRHTKIVESYLMDHLPGDDARRALQRARKMYTRWAVDSAVEHAEAGHIRHTFKAASLALREGPTMIILARLIAAFMWSAWKSMRRRQAR